MREIKFRVWTEKKMVYLPFVGLKRTYQDDPEYKLEFGEDTHDDFFENEEKTVHELMQYTGLKDRNGKEIYEGDIIRMYPDLFNGKPDINEVEDLPDFYERKAFAEKEMGEDWSDCEVVGNIYENPELLNK